MAECQKKILGKRAIVIEYPVVGGWGLRHVNSHWAKVLDLFNKQKEERGTVFVIW